MVVGVLIVSRLEFMDKLAEIPWGAELITFGNHEENKYYILERSTGYYPGSAPVFAKLLNGASIAYASKDRDINAKHHPWLSHITAKVLKSNSKVMENRRRHRPQSPH
jgi:hypothetical protein